MKGETKMNSTLKALCLSGSLALSFFLTKPVLADEMNKRTEFQFSRSVEVPGKVLAPGKYVFELANDGSDGNIVQIFSEDSNGKESLVENVLTIPDYISNTPDKPIVRFEERPAGSPEAIHSWFYPGENTGWEFVYPEEQSPNSSEESPAASPSTEK
jgi:hypothetical protein